MLLAATVIYIQTDNGELVIETNNDRIAVLVNNQGVRIRDEAANREYQLKIGRHRLRAGKYRMDVRELPAGVDFATDEFTVHRRGETVLKATFSAHKDPKYLKDEALRWFPAEATYFTATNIELFPAIA